MFLGFKYTSTLYPPALNPPTPSRDFPAPARKGVDGFVNEGTVLGQDPRGARKKRHWASIAKGGCVVECGPKPL